MALNHNAPCPLKIIISNEMHHTAHYSLQHLNCRYLPRPILARVLRTESLGGGKVCSVSVARHSPSPWGRDVNTFTSGSSTENRRPTLVASSQYASLHHSRSPASPEIKNKNVSCSSLSSYHCTQQAKPYTPVRSVYTVCVSGSGC